MRGLLQIKIGLTAAVIVSQWTWAATLLQSSNGTHAHKYTYMRTRERERAHNFPSPPPHTDEDTTHTHTHTHPYTDTPTYTHPHTRIVAWQYGVSGPFWYASGATVQVLLFGILAIELKEKVRVCVRVCVCVYV